MFIFNVSPYIYTHTCFCLSCICVYTHTHTFMLIVYKVELCQVLEIKQWIKYGPKFEEFKFSPLDVTIVWNVGKIDKCHARFVGTAKYSSGTKSYLHTCLLPNTYILPVMGLILATESKGKVYSVLFQMTFPPIKKTDDMREEKTNQTKLLALSSSFQFRT